MTKETRIFIRGSLASPPIKKRPSRQIYRHFAPGDTLYYKKEDRYYCACDDKPARGFAFKDETGKEVFMPHDFHSDLISYEQALAMCQTAGVYFPRPGHERHGYRVPPPLLNVKTPKKTRPMWNRDAIERHIQECQRRKQNAGIH